VTPEGLNVFPEDVEKVLSQIPGVRDCAVVGAPLAGSSAERVHAVVVLDPGVEVDAVVRAANSTLDDHQRIRRALVWPDGDLPRTEGTRKLKRAAIREWILGGGTQAIAVAGGDRLPAAAAATGSPRSSRSTRAGRICSLARRSKSSGSPRSNASS